MTVLFDINLSKEIKGAPIKMALTQMEKNYRITKLACYTSNFILSTVFCVPPLLFLTFRELYGISYTLLGTLILITFLTQLCIDLVFTFFSKQLNSTIFVKIMTLITSVGLLLYAYLPMIFPERAFLGLVIGTVVFSVSAGLAEVLISPTIAAIPSKTPQKDMSFLHSLYAFGVFTMVIVSTLMLRFLGGKNWHYIITFFALLPIISSVLFFIAPMPEMSENKTSEKSTTNDKSRKIGLALCAFCIFFGACAECTMSNWISSFMENALGVDKTLGDILGTAGFAILLGFGRILYSKIGKNIVAVLLVGMLGAIACYIIVGVSGSVIIAFIACVLTGMFTSMLWPGTLILMEEKIPNPGVGAFALMASFGDLGASFAPQLLGVIIDKLTLSNFAIQLGATLNITAEQVALKIGMLSMAIFPIIGALLILFIQRYFKKIDKKKLLNEKSEN